MTLYDIPYVEVSIFHGDITNWVQTFLCNNKKETTYKHVCEIAEMNLKIARQYDLNSETCYLGGLLHDISAVIECHTTLKANPSKYDISLFLADKLSWDQKGTPPYFEAVVKSLEDSLEAACHEYLQYIFENQLILYPHKWLLDAKEYFEMRIDCKDKTCY